MSIRSFLSRKWIAFGFLIVVVVAAAMILPPLQDRMTIDSASPAMKSLAKQAGLSKTGELIFLRTHPKLDSTQQMATDCAGKSSKDGYVEQGCFDPANNRIYIRDMPSNLKAVEIVTAAHEMLHAVYTNLSDGERKAVNQAAEKEVSTIHSTTLTARLSEYAKLEPSARDNELHSILGTEYDNLSSALEEHYVQYFSNRKLVVTANTHVNNLFKNDENQLTTAQAEVGRDKAAAQVLYNESVAAAQRGDAVGDDYYYGLYSQKIDAINQGINHYNQLVSQYNTLASEYNGQPATQLKTVPTSSQ